MLAADQLLSRPIPHGSWCDWYEFTIHSFCNARDVIVFWRNVSTGSYIGGGYFIGVWGYFIGVGDYFIGVIVCFVGHGHLFHKRLPV